MKLVVVGDLLSGKSSVLEGLTDLPFPCDNGLCTRFATQTTFRRAENFSITVSIIPSPAANPKAKEKLGTFTVDHLNSLSGEEFIKVLSKVKQASAFHVK